MSLWQQDRKNDNRNLFVPHHPDGSIDKTTTLSPIERQFVAGLLDHAPALTALAAPTVNSYKRLTVGESLSGTTWAPAFVAHGPNNRTALVRTLHGRFEWRAPDASANPYLILAGLITAGLDGIERELELGPECPDDLFDATPQQIEERGIAQLPQHLGEAVDALEADAIVCAVGGIALVSASRAPAGSGASTLLGNALLFGAVLCESSYVVIGKKLTGTVSPRRISALVNLWGLALVTPFGLWQALHFDFGAVSVSLWWLLLFYSLAASMWTVWLWMTGLRHVPASRAGVFTVMLPITAAAVGVLLLGERVNAVQMSAFALAPAGWLLATWPARGHSTD